MGKKESIQLSDHFTYRRLFVFVLPTVANMIFLSVYGIVDGLFVSNFVGKVAFASINITFPIFSILGVFGLMIGTGVAAQIDVPEAGLHSTYFVYDVQEDRKLW